MTNPTLGLETAHDVHDQVIRDRLVAVGEDEVDVSADLLAAAVAADDDAFDPATTVVRRVRTDEVRMPLDGLGDVLCFRAGDGEF